MFYFSITVIEEKSEGESLPTSPIDPFSILDSKINQSESMVFSSTNQSKEEEEHFHESKESDSDGFSQIQTDSDSSDTYETPDSFDSGHPQSPHRNNEIDDVIDEIDPEYIKSLWVMLHLRTFYYQNNFNPRLTVKL